MLPTRAEIAEVEQELGFTFRTAHFTVPTADTEPGDTAFYRHDIMPSDLRPLPVKTRARNAEAAAWLQQKYIFLNHQAEDRNGN